MLCDMKNQTIVTFSPKTIGGTTMSLVIVQGENDGHGRHTRFQQLSLLPCVALQIYMIYLSSLHLNSGQYLGEE